MMFIGDATVIGSFNNQFAEFSKVTYMIFQRKNSPNLHIVTLSSCGHSLHLFFFLTRALFVCFIPSCPFALRFVF